MGDWVGLGTGLDAVTNKNNSQPLPGLEPPIIQPIAQRYTTELSQLIFLTPTNNDFIHVYLM
jgi:hypothetical protein